ncbi:C39 family peptidase [Alteraurantiacibacter aquimixticola]|nr:C39 family peptidase [Alteraurantiacibacter aquimixticola]
MGKQGITTDRVRRKIAAGLAAAGTAALLSACASAPGGQATPLWLGAVSSNAPVIPVSVTSWQDRKFDNLVRQRTDFSCGAAVMATIFNFAFGRETTEEQVLVNMLRIADPDIVRQKGFSLLDMKNYAQMVGYEAEGYRVDYATIQALEVPSIALLDIRGYKHFVVVRRAWDDRVAIGDPALGNRNMSRADFEEAWNDIVFVVAGEGYDPQTVLLQPPEPLSARRLMALHASIPGAEVAEFGFTRGFSF